MRGFFAIVFGRHWPMLGTSPLESLYAVDMLASVLAPFTASWVWAALAIGPLMGFFFLLLQKLNIPGRDLIVWRGFGPALAMLPVLGFLQWPSDPVFYITTMVIGLLVSVFDRIMLDSTVIYGAGATSRLLPLSTLGVFLLWFIVDADAWTTLWQTPWLAFAEFACLAIGIGALSRMRHDPISRGAFFYLLPAILLAIGIDILHRIAVTHMADVPFMHGMSLYVFIVSGLGGAGGLMARRLKNKAWHFRGLFTRHMLHAAAMITGFIASVMMLKGWAMLHTPNPSFVTALNLTSAIWVVILGRMMRIPDKANIGSGLVFVGSMIALILLAA